MKLNFAIILILICAGMNSYAAPTWLTCSNYDSSVVRRQVNFPNGTSASTWVVKGQQLKPIEANLPKSAIESFEPDFNKVIESTEVIISTNTDGTPVKRIDTVFSAKVTVGLKDGTDIDAFSKIKTVTENVICKKQEL